MPTDAKAEDMAVTEPSPLNNDIKGPLKEKEKNMKMVTLMPSSDGEGLSILTDSQAGNSITVPQPLRLNHTRRTYLLTITQAVQPRSARLTYSLTHLLTHLHADDHAGDATVLSARHTYFLLTYLLTC